MLSLTQSQANLVFKPAQNLGLRNNQTICSQKSTKQYIKPAIKYDYKGFQLKASSQQNPGLPDEIYNNIEKFVKSNKVVVFMKGSKDFPQCGFSNTVVQILNNMKVPFESIDILETPMLRDAMKIYSSWPTFPQVYVEGEFYGGCDIVLEAYNSGEFQETVERVMSS